MIAVEKMILCPPAFRARSRTGRLAAKDLLDAVDKITLCPPVFDTCPASKPLQRELAYRLQVPGDNIDYYLSSVISPFLLNGGGVAFVLKNELSATATLLQLRL